ncbi:hypothetical protein NGM37_09415 [Streptomyces sp. TRM76130]|nr:hypothetical protein [Streptomyces sp. TRM76130]
MLKSSGPREDQGRRLVDSNVDNDNRQPPHVHRTADCADGGERTVTFQLRHWHDNGEHYDLEHFQLLPAAGGEWRVRVRRTAYWALGRDRLAGLTAGVGFVDARWRMPQETGIFQPLLVVRAGE